MTKLIKGIVIALVAVLAIFGAYKLFPSTSNVTTGASTSFPNGITVGGGTYADSPAFALTGDVIQTGNASTTGTGYNGSGLIEGGLNSTTTGSVASTTGVLSDILGKSLISIKPNLVVGFTYTLPASSTLATLIPNAGDIDRFSIINSTTTDSVSVYVSAGTGTFLQSAASTTRIYPNVAAILTCIRKVNTDIVCLMSGN